MWIFMNNAFVSIVAPKANFGPGGVDPKKFFVVRARLKGDLERAFPGCKIQQDKGTDYRFRTILERGVVMAKIVEAMGGIDYTNFKDSCDHERHMIYMDVWRVMWRAQEDRRPKRGLTKSKVTHSPHDDGADFWDHKAKRWGRR